MLVFLGVVVIGAAVWILLSAFRRPEGAAGVAGRGPDRSRIVTGVIALAVGVGMAVYPTLAQARTRPVDLGRKDMWASVPPAADGAAIRWEGNVLVAELEAGSGRYAVFPVDWNADRFEAEWDLTLTHLDRPGGPLTITENGQQRTHRRTSLDLASVCVGLMDQNAANIDDRDHVSGSALQACFSDDIRLRASDANYIVRTSSSTESGADKVDPRFRPGEPIRPELNRPYRCRLTYDRRSGDAILTVRDGSGAEVATRRLEDLKEFTNSVAWFGVSIRGYNRYDKTLDPKKAENSYTRPKAVARIENMAYRQP